MLCWLVFRGGKAIWSENDRLIFLDWYWGFWFEKIPRAEVASVGPGTIGLMKMNALVIKLKSGRQRSLPTVVLSESIETVLPRLEGMTQARVASAG